MNIQLKHWQNKALVKAITQILFKEDFKNINFEDNKGEYLPEAQDICEKIHQTATIADLKSLIDTVYIKWFDKDWHTTKRTANKEEMLYSAGTAIWKAYLIYRSFDKFHTESI